MSVHEMCTRQKIKHDIGLEVVAGIIGVLIEGETRLTRTGGIGGLSGSDVVLSGLTLGDDCDQQKQQLTARNHR